MKRERERERVTTLLGGKSENQRTRSKVQRASLEHISVSILPKQRYIFKTCLWLSYLMFDNFSAFILLSW